MRRYYFLYLLSICILFASALLLWPTMWINIDVGSFHYHKQWTGPSLSDVTDEMLYRDFDFNLGFDFSGGSEYTLYSFAPTGNVSLEDVQKSVELIEKRVQAVGYRESKVSYKEENNNYLITVQIPDEITEFESVQYILSQKGDVQIWSQRDTPLELESQGTDVMVDYLKSNFEDTGIRIRSVKGIRLKDVEDGIALYIGLNDQDAAEFSEQAYSLYGKTIIIVIDEGGGYPIDGSVLGEQLQYYRSVKTIQILGFEETRNALATASLIQYGPLPVDLFQTETKSLAPQLGVDFVRTEIFVLGASFVFLSIIALVLYRFDGLASILSGFWHMISILIAFKVLQTTITLGGMIAFLLSVIVFWVLISILLNMSADDRRINLAAPLQNSIIANTMRGAVIITILCVSILLLGGGQFQRYIAEAILICIGLLWINTIFTIGFVYRLLLYIKENVT